MPRSPTGSTSGRPRWNIRNMSAVHRPRPLTATSSAATSSSGISSSRSSSSSPADDVLGERAQVARLRSRQAGRGAQLVGVVGEDLRRRRRAAAEARRSAARRSCAPPSSRAAGRRSRARARRSGRRAGRRARRRAPSGPTRRRSARRAPGRPSADALPPSPARSYGVVTPLRLEADRVDGGVDLRHAEDLLDLVLRVALGRCRPSRSRSCAPARAARGCRSPTITTAAPSSCAE